MVEAPELAPRRNKSKWKEIELRPLDDTLTSKTKTEHEKDGGLKRGGCLSWVGRWGVDGAHLEMLL